MEIAELKQQLAAVTAKAFDCAPDACTDAQLYHALQALTRQLAEGPVDVTWLDPGRRGAPPDLPPEVGAAARAGAAFKSPPLYHRLPKRKS